MMTATSSGRTGRLRHARKRPARSAGRKTVVRACKRSDRERRPAAAATRRVGILEGEPRLLEVALEVDRHAVQVLRAEAVYEAAHAPGLDHDVVVQRLVLDVQA